MNAEVIKEMRAMQQVGINVPELLVKEVEHMDLSAYEGMGITALTDLLIMLNL